MTYFSWKKCAFSAIFNYFKDIICQIMQLDSRKTTKFAAQNYYSVSFGSFIVY